MPNSWTSSRRDQARVAWPRENGCSASMTPGTRCTWSARAGSRPSMTAPAPYSASTGADALGEVALLTDSARSVSVRAARATEVIAVDQADFTGLLNRSPALSSALNQSLSRRLQDTRPSASTTRPRPATVALIEVDGRIPLWRLATGLGAALQAHLSVAVLGGEELPGAEVPGAPAAVYGPLLDRAEAGHDLVSAGRRLRPTRAVDEVLPPACRPDPGGDRRWAGPGVGRSLSRSASLRPGWVRRRARRIGRLGGRARSGRVHRT